MKNLKGFSLLLLLPLLLLTCKKYEDDDYWFTLKSPFKRLYGKKRMVEFTVNGADSIPFFEKRYGKGFYVDFTKAADPGSGTPILYIYNKENQRIDHGRYQFDGSSSVYDRLFLDFGTYDNFFYTNLPIKKLTTHELILQGQKKQFNGADSIDSPLPLNLCIKFISID